MWAANEVRARVVDITPRDRRAGHAGRDHHPAADQHLARPPRRPARPGRRRDRRRPPYTRVLLGLLAPTPAPATAFTITRARPTRPGSVSQAPGRATPGPARSCTCPRPRASSSCPTRCPDARAAHLRRLRHHPGDVDAAHPAAPYARAAGSPSCTTPQRPEHQIFADELDAIRRSGHGIDVHLLHPELGDPALSPA